jgi:hypothetical protein
LISIPQTQDYPLTPEQPSGCQRGTINTNYLYQTTLVDPQEDEIQCRFDWGDGNLTDWSSFVPSGSTQSMEYRFLRNGIYRIRSQARDATGLNSTWSAPLNVTIDPDTDGDGLSDFIETTLGSNFMDPYDVQRIIIGSATQYIVTLAGDHKIFYDITTEKYSQIGILSNGSYLIDTNGDGAWDYFASPYTSSVTPYIIIKQTTQTKPIQIPWIFVIIGIIVAIIVIIFVLYKKGYIYVYEEVTMEE